MKLGFVAIDYDGTTEHHGSLHSAVRNAVLELRAKKVSTLMVTGRRIDHLREEVGDLRIFDAVVAENGSVVVYPESGRTAILGKSPPDSMIHALRKRGIHAVAGQCLVEASASDAHTILDVIREQQLPMIIAFNRARLMVLSQGISKGTGLAEALRGLGLSEHNGVAIGDAENDHELLSAVEVGLAVEWGSPALRENADGIIEGASAADVGRYLESLVADPRLPLIRSRRRKLLLGTDDSGGRLDLPIDDRNILVTGTPKSGKSWIAGLICEQLILEGYSVCVVDPEGDYSGLEVFPSVLRFGGDHHLPSVTELLETAMDPAVSVVLNLSRMPQDAKLKYVAELVPALEVLRAESGLPHKMLIDEAHYFAGFGEATDGLSSRPRGWLVVTYRVSDLDPEVFGPDDSIIVTGHTDSLEIEALSKLRLTGGESERNGDAMTGLAMGEAFLMGRTSERPPIRFTIAPRLSRHVRHRTKYIDVPVGEHHAFRFRAPDGTVKHVARSFQEFCDVLAFVPSATLERHLENRDFSRWVRDVFGDRALASRIREIEEMEHFAHSPAVNEALIAAVQERYGS